MSNAETEAAFRATAALIAHCLTSLDRTSRSRGTRSAASLVVAFFLSGAMPAIAQDVTPSHPEGPVVRVTVSLVQIDAVVTDREGRHVTDLGPADFVVRVGGQAREITHVSYVLLAAPAKTERAPATTVPSPIPSDASAATARGRTITLVIDDLHVSYEGMSRVREALHHYLDERLAPGDRVAILRTGGGTATMQQFTSDRARLHAAVDGVRYNFMGTATAGGPPALDSQQAFGGGAGNRGGNPSGRQTSAGQRALDGFREDIVGVGTLGTLRWIARGLAPVPGRKPVVVFSDGFKVFDFNGEHRVEDQIRALTDEANRASVAFYTVDTRGLDAGTVRAEDNVTYMGSRDAQSIPGQRTLSRLGAEESLSYLADRTGGLMVKGSNDPGRGLDRALEDQQGYYVIGYAPTPSFFEAPPGRPAFHKLEVSVRRPGLRVRSRAGFYGVADAATAGGDESRAGRLTAALVSPFAAADVGLRLQALFVDDETVGPSMRAMLRIDGRDVSFAETPDGGRQAVLDVVAATFGVGGASVDRKDQTFTIQTRRADVPAPDTALFYTVDLPVKKPGLYQFRVVVRDAASGRLGAAGEVVAVPDVSSRRLAVSGIVVRGAAAGASGATMDGAQANVGQVTPGQPFEYVFQILNARTDPTTTHPRLMTQVRLWRGREVVYETASTALPIGHAAERRVVAGGRINLSPRLPPGDYTLQVIVTDTLAPRANAVATQWTNLEAVRAP
jgi:VWFA-related protein